MTEVSLFRLYALRAGYLLIAVGLAATVWPIVINHSPQWPLMNSVACSLLAAVSVLAAVGIRYPLQMLPVLLFEIVWKSIWLIAIALPLWSANQIDARTWETVRDCLFGAILIPLIPWRYVISPMRDEARRPLEPNCGNTVRRWALAIRRVNRYRILNCACRTTPNSSVADTWLTFRGLSKCWYAQRSWQGTLRTFSSSPSAALKCNSATWCRKSIT